MHKKLNSALALLLLFTVFGSFKAEAAMSPLSVSIFPPIEFPPQDFAVVGLRVNLLWGKHRSVDGFDFGGLGNITTQHMNGIQVAAGVNYNSGTTTAIGLQAAGLANINVNKASVIGVQAALYNSNRAESTVGGIQVGAINNSPYTKMVGVQAGIYNKARTVYGFQIGLINMTDSLHGLQIGLVNFNHTGVFEVAPILNFGF